MRYLVTCAYDGSNYFGWQKQEGLNTIVLQLETAIKKLFLEDVEVFGSGRTDRFVHAQNQVFHFNVKKEIPCYNVLRALNTLLPNDIHIKNVVNSELHARFNVKQKEYHYYLSNNYDPLKRNYVLYIKEELDIKKMQEAANIFIGIHDFTSFTPLNNKRKNKIRIIYELNIAVENNNIIVKIRGNGFLQYMVRNIVSAIIDVGINKLTLEEVKIILENKKRTTQPKTIAAHGLVLVKVDY